MQQQLRNWIIAQLNTVANIGTVHGYQRYADREKALADLYQYNGRLHGWFVRRLSVVDTVENGRNNQEKTTWLIRGYLAINDATASELEFDSLLDTIRDVFFRTENDYENIAGQLIKFTDNATTGEQQVGFSVLDSQPVMFSGVLCHSAVCQLVTTRIIANKKR